MKQKIKFPTPLIYDLAQRKSKVYIPCNKNKCLYYSLLLINWVGSSIGRAGAF